MERKKQSYKTIKELVTRFGGYLVPTFYVGMHMERFAFITPKIHSHAPKGQAKHGNE